MNKITVAALSAAALLAVGVLVWPESPSGDEAAAGRAVGGDVSAVAGAASGARFPWDVPGGEVPRSAAVDQLRSRPDGRLQVSASTRDVLDTFLAEHPRASPETLAAQFKQAASAHLSEPALSEAADLITRYAAYQTALKAEQAQPVAAPAVEPELAGILRLQQASALREQFLGNEFKEGLYGQEEQMQRYLLARQQILSVQGWSEQQRDEELAALDREYPRAVVEAARKR
jgi:lipase chaperone LimK